MNISNRMLALLAGCLLAVPAALHAGDFPERPLTMLIGFHPGGSTDIQAQALAKVLERQLGQPVRVQHNPGAGGSVAAAMLAGSAEGGYIFQFGVSSTVSFAPLVSRTSYSVGSFRYVAALAIDQPAFVTGERAPFRDWAGLIAHARKGDGLIFATQTAQDRLVARYIAKQEGVALRIVPTPGGGGMAPLVLAGDVDFAFSGGTHTGYTDSGQMKVLAGLAEERLVAYPEAPTLRELGYEVSMHGVRMVTVPASAPDDHVARLAQALEMATRDPEFVEVTEKRLRMPVLFMDGEAVRRLLEGQVREYGRLIEEIGM